MKHKHSALVLTVLAVALALMELFMARPGVASADGLNQWADGFAAQGLNIEVRAMAVDGSGNLYAGGFFTTVGNLVTNYVARRDAATGTWSALGDGIGGSYPAVYALAVDASGNLYAGGRFATAGGVPASNIAWWDPSSETWSVLGSGVNDTVYALAVDPSTGILYVGGDFHTAGGVPASYVAKWDGSTWSAMSYPDYEVNALALDAGGNLYAGGRFGGWVWMWDGSTWSVVYTGIYHSGKVLALAVGVDGNLYAGGTFITAGGVPTSHVAKWDGSTWSTLGGGVDNTVDALAVGADGNLYAGGTFTTAGGAPASHVAKWDGSEWSALGGGVDNTVDALAVDASGNLYAGGSFQTAGGSVANYVALWAGGAWSGLSSGGGGQGMPSYVFALAADGSGGLYAGGRFATAGDVVVNRVARWDPASQTWSALGTGVDGSSYPFVDALAVDGSGNVYAGGRFSTAGGVAANNVAMWDPASETWSALGSGVDDEVSALALDGSGNLYAGGDFTIAGGAPASHVAKWDGSTWSALGSGVGGSSYLFVDALAVDGSGNLYAGGSFSTAGGVAANNVAMWDPASETWSALGSGVGGFSYPYVDALAVDGSGNLYAGGYFGTAGGVPVNNTARWDAQAGTWSALGSGLGTEGDEVMALAVGGCGDLYAGGWFTTAGGVAANNVAHWNGSTWSALGSGVDDEPMALAVDASGNLYAGGWFSTAGGVPSSYIARWDTEPCSMVVTSDADTGPGTLRQAIADVADGWTLTFGGDMTIHLASALTLDRDVTIDGTGHSVTLSGDTDGDGSGDVRVLNVGLGVTAALQHLTVTKGSSDHGAGLYNVGNLILTDCTFSDNSVSSSAGGIENRGMLTVTNSTFSGNSANFGGGLWNGSSGGLAVTDSTFSGNSATYSGGGIYNVGGTAMVTNSTFSGNSTMYYGGGIFNSATATVTDSTFSGNISNYNGGGIYNQGSLAVTDSTLSGNSATLFGGGIYNVNGTAMVTNSTFSGNTATYNDGGIHNNAGTATVRNSLFVKGASGANCTSSVNGANNLLDVGTCGAGSINSPAILLGILGEYGGRTQTIPLLPGSAAIDAGDSAYCPAADQRGVDRVGACDIGAFESQGFTLADLSGTPQSTLLNTAFAQPLGLTVTANDPVEPVDGGLVAFTAGTSAGGATATLSGSPATIAGGMASVSATANGTPGAYDVTASAAGAADVAFDLTNAHPQPVLDAISPASAAVGSGDLTLAVSGGDFVNGSVVRWNGADLATTYVGDTELSATVPAGSLADVGTAQVTVYTEWGGTSSVLAFFVTEATAGVVEQQVSSGTDPSASVAPHSASATGDGLLVVAEYDANPGGTPSFNASGSYFDVYAAPGNSFSQVSIVACGLVAGEKLFWWDGGQGKWHKANPQSYDSSTGCVTLLVDADSSPALSDLQGTYFVAGNTPPVANPGGPYLGAINTDIAFDGSGSYDPDGDPLTYAWDLGDSSTGEGATPSHSYAVIGIYNVCLVVNDGTDDSTPACTLAVVYDPSGGFVTGGGWIFSPAGAYKPDESLSGKATFGFVSRYQKGAQVPTGTTEFQFQAGGFNFHSDSYEWLVVNQAGTNAQFKGSGTINGGLDLNGNEFRFMLWAGDGLSTASTDTFRIRIWWEGADGSENVVYDNGIDQPIGGGSIVVHTR